MNMYVSQFDGIIITVKKEFYHKTASGYWQRKPWQTTTDTFTPEEYIRACGKMFKSDRIEKGYTYAGYIPVKVTSMEPYAKQDKMIITFSFKLKKGE